MKAQCGGTLTLWTWNATFHYALVSYVRLWPGDSDDWSFTLQSVCVCVNTCVLACTCTHTHTFTKTVKSVSSVFSLLHLTDSRHGLNRMSGEDTAALTSLCLPINTRFSIMSTPAPDPWQALSKAGQYGINLQIIHTACRGSVLFNLKWTHLLL